VQAIFEEFAQTNFSPGQKKRALRGWQMWHKLFHHVRYHEADVVGFEQQSAQHLQIILSDRERVPGIVMHPQKASADQDA
jgi:hypothetical protein